jgi:serine/threonine protein kinase
MRYPTKAQYREVLQYSHVSLLDPVLKQHKPERDRQDIVRVWSGGNASTFKLMGPQGSVAIRCFDRNIPDRPKRFAAISTFLAKQTSPIFVPFKYIQEGILVDGQRYPIVQMPWIEGETLSTHLDDNVGNVALFRSLAKQFQELISLLEKLGVAHGDLQHGNIMVRQGRLVLVDYDGMYVPELQNQGLRSTERGLRNYQHPERNDEFNAELDRFSAIVIYLSLTALSHRPDLWSKYAGNENLLLTEKDFHAPDHSKLLTELETIPELSPLVERFRPICLGSLTQVPRLQEFLDNQVARITVQTERRTVYRRNQSVVLDGNNRSLMLNNVGEYVEVIGQITDYRDAKDKNGDPYFFFDFGDYRTGCFKLTVWHDARKIFEKQGRKPTDYMGKWVRVVGLVGSFKKRGGTLPLNPQINIESPVQIEILSNKAEAQLLLEEGTTPVASPPQLSISTTKVQATKAVPSSPSQDQLSETEKKLAQLYGNWPTQSKSTSSLPSPIPQQTAPTLQILTPNLDFKEVQHGAKATQLLRFKNHTASTVRVVLSHQAQGISTYPNAVNCPPNSEGEFEVSLDSTDLSHATIISSTRINAEVHDRFNFVACILRYGTHEIGIRAEGTLVRPYQVKVAPATTSPSHISTPTTSNPVPNKTALPTISSRPFQGIPQSFLFFFGIAIVALLLFILIGRTDNDPGTRATQVPTGGAVAISTSRPVGQGTSIATAKTESDPAQVSPALIATISPTSTARSIAQVIPSATPSFTPIATAIPTQITISAVQVTQEVPKSIETPSPVVGEISLPEAVDQPDETLMTSVCQSAGRTWPIEPLNTTISVNELTFKWGFSGVLPSECGFEVRLWREGQLPLGVHDAVASKQNGSLRLVAPSTYQLSVLYSHSLPSVQGQSGDYYWSISIVEIAPVYRDLGQEQEVGRFRLELR